MARFKFIIEYDGTGFTGWQRQKNGPSVQQSVEEAIGRFARQEVRLHAAGRTDAGVHALGQVAHVDIDTPYSPNKIREAVNHFLRHSHIVIVDIEVVDEDFHARFSAKYRQYLYRIVNRRAPLALEADRAWHVPQPLDLEAMQRGANLLLGKHNFNSFRSAKCQAKVPIRTLDMFQLEQSGQLITATLQSRSFLHNQVRAMMGTLVQIGKGQRMPEDIPDILAAENRKAAGENAPPFGLYFNKVGF